jgi:hypothetical protein
MITSRKKVDFMILILKCYLIILTLGLILPKIIDLALLFIINRYTNYKNSTFVLNIITKNELLMCRYIYIFDSFFKL